MTTHDITPLNIAQCVCKRPKMYTSGGTLAEVLAFLSGYEFGFHVFGIKPKDDSPGKSLTWLDEQVGIDRPQPALRYEAALKRYQSESNVLAAIDDFAATLHKQ